MTIHGSKSELKQLRYLENFVGSVSLLPEAITVDPTVGFSIFFNGMKTRHLDISRETKISSIGV